MRSLRRQNRKDRLQTELRSNRMNIGRWVYLGLLSGLIIWLLNSLFGDMLYLSASGLVTQDRQTVSVSFPATVKALHVEEGQQIAQGDPLASLESVPLLRDIAGLSAELGEFQRRRAELRSERTITERMLPVAIEQQQRIADLLDQRRNAVSDGLSTNLTLHEIIRSDYASAMEAEQLRARAEGLGQEISRLDGIITDFQTSIDRLRDGYNNGEVIALSNGVITDMQINRGSGVAENTRLMDVVVGEAHVLAYVSPGALYEIREGDAVALSYGVEQLEGQITRILPLSVRLPTEFQRTFQPQERSQIVRISLDSGPVPPTFTKVNVRSALPLWTQTARLFQGEG